MFLACSNFLGKFEPRCFYTIVLILIKKACTFLYLQVIAVKDLIILYVDES